MEKEIKSYRDLIVWQKAMELVVECYTLSGKLPKSEVYGLIPDIRKAAIRVPAYIADGQGREALSEYIQRLSWAEGSLKMLETYWLAVEMLGFLPATEISPILDRCTDVGKLLAGLMRSLRGGRH
jgi:four helix bundle protein